MRRGRKLEAARRSITMESTSVVHAGRRICPAAAEEGEVVAGSGGSGRRGSGGRCVRTTNSRWGFYRGSRRSNRLPLPCPGARAWRRRRAGCGSRPGRPRRVMLCSPRQEVCRASPCQGPGRRGSTPAAGRELSRVLRRDGAGVRARSCRAIADRIRALRRRPSESGGAGRPRRTVIGATRRERDWASSTGRLAIAADGAEPNHPDRLRGAKSE